MLTVKRTIIFFFFLFTGAISISAQSSTSTTAETRSGNPPDRPSSYDPFSRSPIDEMRIKMRLKAEEKEFKENLERAEESERICTELLKAVESNQTFTSDEKKKLERLEKLIKRIRNASGGDDDDVNVTTQSPNLNDLIKKIAEETESLNKEFKKTTRNVVSASVIQKANAILDIIKIVRSLPDAK